MNDSVTPHIRSLDQLSIGETATILEVSGNDAVATRLMEMGVIEGDPIKLIGIAPLGDPLEFLVCDYRLSLRRNEAARVQIRLGGPQ